MAITYPVDVANTRWAVYQVSTGQILARNQSWPHVEIVDGVAQGLPISGLDPDYVYLLHVNDAEPDYDSRLFQLIGTETVDVDANELQLTWESQARPTDERVMAAQNREAEQLEKVIGNLAREAIETRLIVGAILNYALKNQTYPTKVKNLVDDYIAKAIKVWGNRDVLHAKLDAITAGQTPDLDSDWVE